MVGQVPRPIIALPQDRQFWCQELQLRSLPRRHMPTIVLPGKNFARLVLDHLSCQSLAGNKEIPPTFPLSGFQLHESAHHRSTDRSTRATETRRLLSHSPSIQEFAREVAIPIPKATVVRPRLPPRIRKRWANARRGRRQCGKYGCPIRPAPQRLPVTLSKPGTGASAGVVQAPDLSQLEVCSKPARRQPSIHLIQPVISPERLAIDDDVRRAKNALRQRGIDFIFQPLLDRWIGHRGECGVAIFAH